MLGNLKDLLGGNLGDAGDLIGTLGKVVTKAKPVDESEATAAPAKENSGGLLGGILDAVTDGPTEIRVIVLDGNGKEKRDMAVPISIVRTALDMGADALNLDEKFNPDTLITLLETRGKGLLFDFDDPTDDDVIKIYLQ
jgi:hypothetical protein